MFRSFPSHLLFLLLLFAATLPRPGAALEKPAEQLSEAGVEMRQGDEVDLALNFRTSNGRLTSLESLLLEDRPTILVPAYYDCPRLCGLLLQGLVTALNKISLKIGRDFQVVTVSFDTSEGPEDAAREAANFRAQYRDETAATEGWRFLVGDDENVAPLMRSIGFSYIPDMGEFAHAATLVILTPKGKISQYFAGVEFSAPDLRLALVEASEGKIGDLVDQVFLFCFRFDPTKGKYTWAALLFMRIGGILTLILIGTVILRYRKSV